MTGYTLPEFLLKFPCQLLHFQTMGFMCYAERKEPERAPEQKKSHNIHIGVAATQMERKGIATERGAINREIIISNRDAGELR